jgi:hypothetical protein
MKFIMTSSFRTAASGHPIPDHWWTGGLCSAFAVALQRRFGGELWAIVNHSEAYPEDDQLMHAYCVVNGLAYDAKGSHPIAEAADVSPERYPIEEMDKNLQVSMVWRKVDVAWLNRCHDDFNMGDVPAANAYIDAHPELFSGLKKVRGRL